MIDIVKFTVQTKKAGRQNYLNEDEESLLVASAKIEGNRGLPLDCRAVAQQFQNFVKAVNYQCSDYNIKENHPSGIVRKE